MKTKLTGRVIALTGDGSSLGHFKWSYFKKLGLCYNITKMAIWTRHLVKISFTYGTVHHIISK